MNVNESALSVLLTIWFGIINRCCYRGRHHRIYTYTHIRTPPRHRCYSSAIWSSCPFSLQPIFYGHTFNFRFFAFVLFFICVFFYLNDFFHHFSGLFNLISACSIHETLYTRNESIFIAFCSSWVAAAKFSEYKLLKKVFKQDAKTRSTASERDSKKPISVRFWPVPVS